MATAATSQLLSLLPFILNKIAPFQTKNFQIILERKSSFKNLYPYTSYSSIGKLPLCALPAAPIECIFPPLTLICCGPKGRDHQKWLVELEFDSVT